MTPEQRYRKSRAIVHDIYTASGCVAGTSFIKNIKDAIGIEQKDLTNLHWPFLKDCLENLPPPQEDDVDSKAIKDIIDALQCVFEFNR